MAHNPNWVADTQLNLKAPHIMLKHPKMWNSKVQPKFEYMVYEQFPCHRK